MLLPDPGEGGAALEKRVDNLLGAWVTASCADRCS